MIDDLFALHEASLIGSWRLLASVDPAGEVVADATAVTMAHSHPALCNALLRTPEGLDRVRKVFGDRHHAVWVRDPWWNASSSPDASGALARFYLDQVLEAAGYRRDERTVPMVLDLRAWDGAPAVPVARVSPGDVAEHSGVGRAMLADVPHTHGHATEGWESWAITMTTDAVANISFVTTRDEFQRRGLGRAVMTQALRDARDRGETHATLQSTPAGLRLYHGLGFRDVGSWQEWVPAR
ncbi:hypothetical protein Ade02nite_09440 [Paractinoplanes deccanensis]|uniref:N-acetyltransferase domain-containing protein n=1 Tax=Paractinoplanes deccanensis TaxID=113561 RepID=A0ABQ3XX35_9ACTN|nr:GNAT family N-acetyltransferase [Actinoplanes deccanensis]GID72303.1 hypothetical protein Ade02nite_09440 [Actinoplanes deccanensis]